MQRQWTFGAKQWSSALKCKTHIQGQCILQAKLWDDIVDRLTIRFGYEPTNLDEVLASLDDTDRHILECLRVAENVPLRDVISIAISYLSLGKTPKEEYDDLLTQEIVDFTLLFPKTPQVHM